MTAKEVIIIVIRIIVILKLKIILLRIEQNKKSRLISYTVPNNFLINVCAWIHRGPFLICERRDSNNETFQRFFALKTRKDRLKNWERRSGQRNEGAMRLFRGVHSIFRGLTGPMFLPFASIESWDAKNVLVLFRLFRAKTDFLEERCSSLSPPPSLSLSFEKQKDRDGGNALIRFIPSSHRLWSYFPEISLLGTSSPHFFIPLLTALFYLKSISLLTKPFRPTFNAIRNTFSHLWRIYSKVQSSFFSKEMLNKQTNRIWSLDYYVALYYHFDSMLTSSC